MVHAGTRWWNIYFSIIFFTINSQISTLDISVNVDIMKWTIPENVLVVTCSITTLSSKDVKHSMVHLHCPLVASRLCFTNCSQQCVQNSGICENINFKNVFQNCIYVSNSDNRIDLHYHINANYIPKGGEWQCEYRGRKSRSIMLDKNVKQIQRTTSATSSTESFGTTTIASVPSSSTSKSVVTTTNNSVLELYFGKMNLITGILVALCVSILCNAFLIAIVCISRSKLQLRKKKTVQKVIENDPTETTSMLTRSSVQHPVFNRSVCSGTSSLESQSFKESLQNYISDGSAVLSTHLGFVPGQAYYADPSGRYFRVINTPTNIEYRSDVASILSHHSSGDVPLKNFIHLQNFQDIANRPKRVSSQSSYIGDWSQTSPQHQESFSSTRVSGSQQHISLDSNYESGLGSDFLGHSVGNKREASVCGSNNLDLIHNCKSRIPTANSDS